MAWVDHPLIFMGEDFVAEICYRVTYRGCPAKLSGPPESCYPAEDPEFEIDKIILRRDDTTFSPGHVCTGKLFECLCWYEPIQDAVLQDIADQEEYGEYGE